MTAFFTRAFVWLLGVLLLAAGLVFTASLAVAALLLGAVALASGLLRGERPRLRMHLRRGFGAAPGRPGSGAGEIVDIEAREVPEARPVLGPRDASRRD
jgi:hypothetical protein